MQVLTEASVEISSSRLRLVAAMTRVHLPCSRPSQRFELTFLQHAKQLGLQIEREFANLVQEQRAPIRLRETPVPSSRCACEAPSRARRIRSRSKTRESQRNLPAPTLRRARARIVDGAGHKLLARAGLAQDEDGRVGRSDLADRIANTSGPRAAADDTHFPGRLSDDCAQGFRLLYERPDAPLRLQPLAHATKKDRVVRRAIIEVARNRCFGGDGCFVPTDCLQTFRQPKGTLTRAGLKFLGKPRELRRCGRTEKIEKVLAR